MKISRSLAFIILLLALITACTQTPAFQPERYESSVVAYVPVTKGHGVTELTEWIQANPNLRIRSLSGILRYRDDVTGFTLVLEEGDGQLQEVFLVARPPGVKWNQSYGVPEVDAWIADHPEYEDIEVTAVPDYSGGVKAYVILASKKGQ